MNGKPAPFRGCRDAITSWVEKRTSQASGRERRMWPIVDQGLFRRAPRTGGAGRRTRVAIGALDSERWIAQTPQLGGFAVSVPGTRSLRAPKRNGTSRRRGARQGEAGTWAHAARGCSGPPRTSGRSPPPAWRSDTGTWIKPSASAPKCLGLVSSSCPVSRQRSFRCTSRTLGDDDCALWTLSVSSLPRGAEIVKPATYPRNVIAIRILRASWPQQWHHHQRIQSAYSWWSD